MRIPLLLLILLPSLLVAQQRVEEGASQAIGLRVGTTWNRYMGRDLNPMVEHFYSHTSIGLTYKFYGLRGHAELAANVGFKGDGDEGWNFPVVAQDYTDDYNTSLSQFDFGFKVGPRVFRYFYPKFGLTFAYLWKAENMIDVSQPFGDDAEFRNWYLALPMGVSFDFPTSFGTTGVGFFYEIGLTQSLVDYPENSYRNGFVVEIHAAIRTIGER